MGNERGRQSKTKRERGKRGEAQDCGYTGMRSWGREAHELKKFREEDRVRRARTPARAL